MSFRLPRLPRTVPIVNEDGTPTVLFQRWWQSGAEDGEVSSADLASTQASLTATQGDLSDTQADITAAQADITAAQADITAAQADITAAQADITALEALSPTYVVKDQTSAWATPTGTLDRTTFASATAFTVSNPPTQAEVQAIAAHVVVLSQRMAALVSDLRGNDVLT